MAAGKIRRKAARNLGGGGRNMAKGEAKGDAGPIQIKPTVGRPSLDTTAIAKQLEQILNFSLRRHVEQTAIFGRCDPQCEWCEVLGDQAPLIARTYQMAYGAGVGAALADIREGKPPIGAGRRVHAGNRAKGK